MTWKDALVEELHKPARRTYPRRKVIVRGLDDTWQADLVDVKAYGKQNKQFKYLLTCIDVMSKYAWVVPLKQKTGAEATKALKSIFRKSKRMPKNLQVDQGTEFYNEECKNLLKKPKINLYSTYSHLKASIVERFNRTLKTNMWKQFSLRGNHKWHDIVQDLVTKYNDTKHRTIQTKPRLVTSKNESEVLEQFRYTRERRRKKPKFAVGDRVRVSKYKHVFEKGYTPNWTVEIFTVVKVLLTRPYTYILKDYQNTEIAGGFYEEELLKVKHDDVYLIEKTLRRKGNQRYVKWLGFDKSHNSWTAL